VAALRAAAVRAGLGEAARVARRALADLEAFAFPQQCPACAREASPRRLLCEACWSSIPRPAVPLCVRCLALGKEPVGCGHAARRTWAAFLYDERAALLVRALKYAGRPALGRSLGEAIAEALPPSYRPDLVLEVPLHAARLRERGYNQASLLADALARRLDAPRLPGALVRVRPTPPQPGLGPGRRRENLAGAIRLTERGALAGRRVLVVDDVVTTGATMDACLAALAAERARGRGAAFAWAQ
jgi:ComF family protein